MRIRIDYTTTYDYALPATGVVQLLRVEPRRDDNLLILEWRVDVDADGSLRPGHDVFGNRTHIFYAEGAIRQLVLRVTGDVITTDSHGVLGGSDEPLPRLMYLRSTALTGSDAALDRFADSCRGGGDADTLHRLLLALYERKRFDADATTTITDAATAFAHGAGVCQDFTHIFCTAARHLGIPARYVSGHFVNPETQPASHAWAEAWIDDLGWVGFDPTYGISASDGHVRVAVGLDYLDAAPVRGARRGGGDEAMHVAVRVLCRRTSQPQSQSQSQSQSQG